uniref:NADH dehydrogenase [ubiquinone] 1 beta subcomplex subunit 8, mitochondrial n=1 Tax=Leptobrachium leishanense TaxID=445787 RepID=A0A8C5PPQ7_9ANUR
MAALRARLVISMTCRSLFRATNRTGSASLMHKVGVRPASGFSKDDLPGPFPKTPEEKAAAAKKYNMRVEDYEPYPDDGMGYGDYPKLPDKSQHERDPWYSWDQPDLRRNWGETMHWDFDMYLRNRVDTSPTMVPWNTMCKQLVGFIGFMLFMFWVGEMFPIYPPVAPKQYPYNNLYLESGGDPSKEPSEIYFYERSLQVRKD